MTSPRPLRPGENPLEGVTGRLLDIRAEFEVGGAKEVGLSVNGTEVIYNAARRDLVCKDRRAPMAAGGGRVRLRLLADRTSLEVFGDDGLVYMPVAVMWPGDPAPPSAFARGGTATLRALEVHELRSIWPERPE